VAGKKLYGWLMSRKLRIVRTFVTSLAITFVWFLVSLSRADQLEMQNGDHYLGKVISMTTTSVVLQSEVLGTVTLPRNKIALLTLGANSSTNFPVSPAVVNGQVRAAPTITASLPKAPVAAKQPGTDKSVLKKVESEYLSEATPEARAKFNQMAGGLLTGRLSVNDIRKEAKAAADQLRALRGDAGDETGMVDSYLAILDNFLKESGPSAGAVTNASAALPKPKPGSVLEEE
jgi:hypothetical protein